MIAHLKLCCKLNYVALLFSPTCSCSRFSASLLSYTNSIITDDSYWNANPNLIFYRFQSNVKNTEKILEGIEKFKKQSLSEFKITYAFTIKREIAATIANKVMSSVLKKGKSTTVIEINPGPGLISQELFKNGLDKLIVYDYLNCPYFMKWCDDNKERINLIQEPILNSAGFNMSLFYSMPSKGSRYIIILSLPHLRFFRRLFYHIACICEPSEKFVRSLNYGLCSVLFDIEVLDEFKCCDFLPAGIHGDKLYFIHFMRKAKPLLLARDAKNYFLFLLIVTSRKSRLFLKTLERWFPGIGPAAIARGIKVTSCSGDLNGEELLKIFLMIKDLGYDPKIFNSITGWRKI